MSPKSRSRLAACSALLLLLILTGTKALAAKDLELKAADGGLHTIKKLVRESAEAKIKQTSKP